jgi:hypothetical protein
MNMVYDETDGIEVGPFTPHEAARYKDAVNRYKWAGVMRDKEQKKPVRFRSLYRVAQLTRIRQIAHRVMLKLEERAMER